MPTWPSAPRPCPSSATAARCSCSRTSSTSSGRAGRRRRSWPAWRRCCPRTSGCTSRRFPTCRSSAAGSSSRAARSTTSPRSSRRSTSSSRVRGTGVEAGGHRPQALRRVGRHRLRARSPSAGHEQRPSDDVHRSRCRAADPVSHHANEDTRCYFCKNKCLRTFIDVKTTIAPTDWPRRTVTHMKRAGGRRIRRE